MKLLSQKLLTILLITVLLLSSSICMSAAPSENDSLANNKESNIISQAIDLDKSGKIQGEYFSIVSLAHNSTDARSIDNTGNETSKAIQSISTNDEGLVKVTTIFPYKCLPSGELVNSFEYKPAQTRNTSNVTTEFVDTSITVIAYYAHYFSFYNMANFYRHAGIEAYWNSSNSSANVSKMYVHLDSAGELYKYDECLTQSLTSTIVDDHFSIRSTISENNPIKGELYIDGYHAMPLNRVLLITDYWEHGGLIYLELTYSVNGKNYTHYRSYYVYSK